MKNLVGRFKEGAGHFLYPLFFAVALGGCTQSPPASSDPARNALIQKGRAVYQTSCVACHNPDPKKVGAVGPEVFGSTKELLEMRIIQGKYPPGYKPKRTSNLMTPLPQFKTEIDGLHAYLNQ